MSTTEEVVKLRLDTSGFSAGVKSAMSSIKSLEKGLSMDGAVDGISRIQGAFNKLNFSGIADSVSQATNAFPMLETAAAVALGNIGAKAAMIGANLIKSLALTPLTDGFKEYELQLNSVQTILANTKSKGESIATVNAALDDLNTYADKTIYNFSEMTHNIGMFTAAGTGLEESKQAIKGLSNVAALFGVDSQNASQAMYQLSQAISSGTVKLMDWRSLENAGMSGEQFQKGLIRTAEVHGIAVNDMIAENGSFRDSLQEGWLTSEIMIETLNQMTGDMSDAQLEALGYNKEQIAAIQDLATTAADAATKYKTFSQVKDATTEALSSGWASTFRIIMGDFEQARALWTPIGNALGAIIDHMSDARNALLQSFVDLGGRVALLGTLKNLLFIIVKPLQAVVMGFKQAFAPKNAQGAATLMKALESMTSSFVLSEKNVARLTAVFRGLFSVIKALIVPIGWVATAIGAVIFAVVKLIGWIGSKLITPLLFIGSIMSKLGVLLLQFVEWLNPIGRLLSVVGLAVSDVARVMAVLGSIIKSQMLAPIEALHSALSPLGEFFVDLWHTVSDFVNGSKTGFGEVVDVAGVLHGVVMKLGEVAKTALTVIFGGLAAVLMTIADVMKDYIVPGFLDFMDVLSDVGVVMALVLGGGAYYGGSFLLKQVSNLTGMFVDLKTEAEHVGVIFKAVFQGQHVGAVAKFDKVIVGFAKNFKNLYDFVSDIVDIFVDLYEAIFKPQSAFVDATAAALEFGDAVDGATEPVSLFMKFLTDLKNVLTGLFSADIYDYVAALKSDFGAISSEVKHFVDNLKNLSSISLSNPFSFWGEDTDAASEAIDHINSRLPDSAGTSVALATAIFNLRRAATALLGDNYPGLLESVNNGLDAAQKAVTDLSGAFAAAFQGGPSIDWASPFMAAVQGVFDAIAQFGDVDVDLSTKIVDIFTAGGQLAKMLAIGIVDGVSSIGSELKIAGTILAYKLKDGFESALSEIEISADILLDRFKQVFGPIAAELAVYAKDALEAVGSIFGIEFPKTIAQGAADAAVKAKGPLTQIFKGFEDWASDAVPNIVENLKRLGDAFKSLFDWLGGAVSSGGGVLDFFNKFEFSTTHILAALSGFSAGAFMALMFKIAGSIKDISNVIGSLTEPLEALSTRVKSEALLKVAFAMGILAVSMILIATVDSDRLDDVLIAMSVNMLLLVASMKALSDININRGDMVVLAISILAFSFAVLILSSAAKKLASVDRNALIQGTAAVGALILGIVALGYAMSKIKGSMSPKNALSLVIVAGAVYLLGMAVAKLGSLDQNALIQGGVAVGLMLAAIAIFAKVTENTMDVGAALSLLALTWLIKSIAEVIEALGVMDTNVMIQGTTGLAIALGIIVAAIWIAGQNKDLYGTALAVLAVVGTVYLMALAIQMYANMELDVFVEGTIKIAIILAVLAIAIMGFSMAMGSGGLVGVVGIIAIAVALLILAVAINMLGTMPWEHVKHGLTIVAIALGMLIIAGYLATGAAPGLMALGFAVLMMGIGMFLAAAGVFLFSIAVTSLAGSLVAFTPALKIFLDMLCQFTDQAVGLMELGGAMILLGIGIVALSIGVAAFALAMGALGIALILLSIGLFAITMVGPAAMIVIKDMIKQLEDLAGFGLAKLIPVGAALTGIGIALTAFGIGAIAAGIGSLLLSATLPRVIPLLKMAADAIDEYDCALVAFGDHSSILGTMGEAVHTFGLHVSTTSKQLNAQTIRFRAVTVATNQFGTAITRMGDTSTMAYNRSAKASNQFATQTTVMSKDVGSAVKGMAPIVSVGGTAVAAAFTQMSTKSSSALTVFAGIVTEAGARTNKSMISMAGFVRAGSKLVVASLTELVNATRANVSKLGSAFSVSVVATKLSMSKLASAVSSGAKLTISQVKALASGVKSGMSDMTNGIAEGVSGVKNTVGKIPSAIASAKSDSIAKAKDLGTSTGKALGGAVKGQNTYVYNQGVNLGEYMAEGMAKGIANKKSNAINAAIALAKDSLSAAKEELDIHSPSREFAKLGMYSALGLAKGMDDTANEAISSAQLLAHETVNAVSDVLDNDFNPVITPVLDLSQVESNASALQSLIAAPSITPTGSIELSQTAAVGMRQNGSSDATIGESSGTTVNYTQNNYSPHALDRFEIYRQTKNQISMMKRESKAL